MDTLTTPEKIEELCLRLINANHVELGWNFRGQLDRLTGEEPQDCPGYQSDYNSGFGGFGAHHVDSLLSLCLAHCREFGVRVPSWA